MQQVVDEKVANALVAEARAVWPQNFAKIEETFNSCCFAMAFKVVRDLGLFRAKGEFENWETICKKVAVFKDAEYVLRHILRILCDEGVVAEQDGGWICLDAEPYIEPPAESFVMATRIFPEEGASFQWLARASDGLVPFIRGEMYAEEVMFPMGSFKLVEEVYNTSNVYGFYSRLAGKAVKHFAEQLPTGAVSLIEIGAGTGNGTENVLRETTDRFARYIFTDVSKSLVQMGRRRFKKFGYDFLEYATFDACKDIAEQDIKEELVDVVLAVNVLHATNDIMQALRGARKLLKTDGVLILSEIAPPENGIYRYMELTFGILPSYSEYRDRALRPVAPIIRPQEWVNALSEAGFRQATAIPGETVAEMDRGGIVIGVK